MRNLSTYFYRYEIRSNEDLSASTIQRRLKKASQNTTTHLFMDLTNCNLKMLNQSPFFEHAFESLYLIAPSQYLSLEPFRTTTPADFIICITNEDDIEQLQKLKLGELSEQWLYFSPETKKDLQALNTFEAQANATKIDVNWFWDFKPYTPQVKNSLTLTDISSYKKQFRRLPGLEIYNRNVPDHFELEPTEDLAWQFKTQKQDIQLSFIIPSYNNIVFLSNVVSHLMQQTLSADQYEIIICEDGGTDQSISILRQLYSDFKDQVNLKVIYWSKKHAVRGEQFFFRAGQARNLATQFAVGAYLFFLDSDMLTPPQFAETVLAKLKKHDVIQFERHHINQTLSLTNPRYETVNLQRETYIEEDSYWRQLFNTKEWMSLTNYWKYTCTYALGMKKTDFLTVGRFKKYYVSYGFEDTDLGYELHLREKSFHLVQIPLLHLTAYDKTQYKNSSYKRMILLKKTAKLFYLQHLNPLIHSDFGNFFSFEKPLKNLLRDLF